MPIHRGVVLGVVAMTVIVAASNVLVQFQINDWLTWGAFTYPVAFLVTDLTNRALGPTRARQVVFAGFAIAILLSIVLATPRIAIASGAAFLVAQLLDIGIFDRMRRIGVWWAPPLVSSSIASAVDTALFFSIAFVGTSVPWITLGFGDYAVKLALALSMLIPFRALMHFTRPQQA
ncbi:MAG: queuosine precursor transporter [Rhodospirillaceae bacterium]